MKNTLDYTIALIALLLTLLAVTPEQWNQSIADWRVALTLPVKLTLASLIGFMFGLSVTSVRRKLEGKLSPRIFDAASYEKLVRNLVLSRKFQIIKIFGYTGETVAEDLLRFEDRYRGDLEIRMLHRSWVAEAADERVYNDEAAPPRPWLKASGIRRLGLQPWTHALRREIRYYSHQPIVKGAILCRPRGEGRVACLTFYRWVQRPAEGGSPFKGTNMYMVYLTDDMPGARNLIDYAESQFDYEWQQGLTPDKVKEIEEAGLSSSEVREIPGGRIGDGIRDST